MGSIALEIRIYYRLSLVEWYIVGPCSVYNYADDRYI